MQQVPVVLFLLPQGARQEHSMREEEVGKV